MKKIRCDMCGRRLLDLDYGKLEIKCPRCGHIMRIEHNKVMSREGASEQSSQPALKK